jgi:hypothetical protein
MGLMPLQPEWHHFFLKTQSDLLDLSQLFVRQAKTAVGPGTEPSPLSRARDGCGQEYAEKQGDRPDASFSQDNLLYVFL